jgi:hypothetical protein
LLEQPTTQASDYDALLETSRKQPQSETTLRKGLETAQKTLGLAQEAYMGAIAPGFLVEKALYPSVSKKFEEPLVSPETATSIVHAALTPLRKLETIAFGERGARGAEYAEKFIGEQAAGLTSPENLALAAVGGAIGKLGKVAIPKLAETAFGKAPPVPPELSESAAETVKTEAQIATANVEAAPVTQEQPGVATDTSPKVREAISVDELRLMRERNELQLQNEIAKRATGGTHPAVDERIGQIDEELTNIANRELQLKGGGEIKGATQEGTIAEGNIVEYPRDVEGGTSTEAGGRSGVVTGAEEQGTKTVMEIPEGTKATVRFRTETGEHVSQEMDAKEAEGIFTKERSSYQALLDCLGR